LTKILVIDDDRSVRHLINSGLNGHHGFEILTAEDGDAGMRILQDEKPSVCLLDVYLPEYNGLELFRKIRAIDSKLPVIFITGDTSSETAIEAMRAGAFDYVAKPLNIHQLRQLMLSASRARSLMDQPVALTVGDGFSAGERFIGNSKMMIEVFKDIGRVASQSVTVLIRGESGSGKELVARALVNHSDRSNVLNAGGSVALNSAMVAPFSWTKWAIWHRSSKVRCSDFCRSSDLNEWAAMNR
jgi:DNA-binding NtrC family response regulator